MGTTMEDIYMEMSLEDDYLEEIRQKAIEGAAENAITDYYIYKKDLLVSTITALENAKKHLDFCPTSTIIYSGIAQEIMLKELLFRPIVFGSINNEIASDILVYYIFNNKSPFRVNKINEMVIHYAGIDFNKYKREKSKQVIWKEMDDLAILRNKAMHQGSQFTKTVAKFNLKLVFDCYKLLTKEAFENLGIVLKNGLIERKAWQKK